MPSGVSIWFAYEGIGCLNYFYMYCVCIRSSFLVRFHNMVVLGSFASQSLQLFSVSFAIIANVCDYRLYVIIVLPFSSLPFSSLPFSSLPFSLLPFSSLLFSSLPFASPVCVVIIVELFVSFNVCISTFRCLLGSMHLIYCVTDLSIRFALICSIALRLVSLTHASRLVVLCLLGSSLSLLVVGVCLSGFCYRLPPGLVVIVRSHCNYRRFAHLLLFLPLPTRCDYRRFAYPLLLFRLPTLCVFTIGCYCWGISPQTLLVQCFVNSFAHRLSIRGLPIGDWDLEGQASGSACIVPWGNQTSSALQTHSFMVLQKSGIVNMRHINLFIVTVT